MAANVTAGKAQEVLDDEALAEERLLDELETSEIPAHIREAQLAEFKKRAAGFQKMKEKEYGKYTQITEEKGFLDLTTQEERCVVHFYHEDFRRCSIMDGHLQKLAEKYFETKFAKINVEKCKFFVNKLKIQILPSVFCFKEGIVVDKIVGFEELGNTDNFDTEILERRLGRTGVIELSAEDEPNRKTIFGCSVQKEDSDDSD